MILIVTQYSLVKEESNVIIRNLGVKKVLAANGDAIGVREYIMLRDIYFSRKLRKADWS